MKNDHERHEGLEITLLPSTAGHHVYAEVAMGFSRQYLLQDSVQEFPDNIIREMGFLV